MMAQPGKQKESKLIFTAEIFLQLQSSQTIPQSSAIITNKPQDITEAVLVKLSLEGHFNHLIGMHAGFEPKPDPSGVRYVITSEGVGAQETIFIGDSRIDAETSRNAGIDFGFAAWGYDSTNGYNPAIYFKSAYDLIELGQRSY